MARLTKYEIASLIEKLPGNRPWGLHSLMTVYCDSYTRAELVEIYNSIVNQRGIETPQIS